MNGAFLLSGIVGTILGFLSGIGIGGGSLLILWLTLVMKLDPATARCINLMYFVPCALCASFFRMKQGSLPLKKILLPTALGCASAAGFTHLAHIIDAAVLRKLFGILLIITGIRELLYRKRPISSASEN